MTLQQFAAWWDDLADPKVATSAQTLADWKADIEKLCTYSGDCTAQVQAQVTAFAAKLNAAHAAATKGKK